LLCSCVAITLPAASKTRITASPSERVPENRLFQNPGRYKLAARSLPGLLAQPRCNEHKILRCFRCVHRFLAERHCVVLDEHHCVVCVGHEDVATVRLLIRKYTELFYRRLDRNPWIRAAVNEKQRNLHSANYRDRIVIQLFPPRVVCWISRKL